MIASHYFRTWFLLDFFGSVPFDKIVTAAVTSSGFLMTKHPIIRIPYPCCFPFLFICT